MKTTSSSITLDVDLANPGQFLACCGLLELASRVDPEALGWFEGPLFHLTVARQDIIERLLDCSIQACAPTADDDADSTEKSPPVELGAPFNLILNWWEDQAATRAGFKTWSGGQTVLGFVEGMRGHLTDHADVRPPRLFDVLPLKKPKPFYFDSRISRLTSLDLGFSAEGFTTSFSPAVELLALIGLQRFRPQTVIERERYAFATWNEPLGPLVASAVAHRLITTLADRSYVFSLVVRTGGKYKAFGPATLERSFHA